MLGEMAQPRRGREPMCQDERAEIQQLRWDDGRLLSRHNDACVEVSLLSDDGQQ